MASNAIPWPLQTAVYELAARVAAGVDILPDVAAKAVLKEKFGPIEITYDEHSQGAAPAFPLIDRLIAPLLARKSTGAAQVRLTRT